MRSIWGAQRRRNAGRGGRSRDNILEEMAVSIGAVANKHIGVEPVAVRFLSPGGRAARNGCR